MAAYHDREGSDVPFAVYTLCSVDEVDITEIIKICDSACEIEGQVIRPPRHHFPEGRLRDVVEYHVELARDGQFDPKYFMVVACPERRLKGVVIVALDDDEMRCKPDLLWLKAEDSGLALVNLQMSNVSWEELKEDSLGSASLDDDNNSHDSDQNEYLGKAPGISYHIGVYVRSDIDTRALLREIEPAADVKQASEMVCKALRAVPENEGSRGDLFSRAAIAHPYKVSRHPTLHKRMFLVADKIDCAREGLHLVNLDWDGETDSESEQELKETGQTAGLKCISVGTHAGVAGDWAAVFVFSRIAAKGGLANWRPKHVLDGAYSLPYPDCDIKVQ